jgi:hypothetical protein
MSNVEPTVDPTGTLSPTDINSKALTTLTTEFNRSQALLDSLNQTPKIIAKGTGTITWDGTANFSATFQTNLNVETDYTYLVYFSRSDQAGNLYKTSFFQLDNSGNLQWTMNALTNKGILTIGFNSYQVGSPIVFTISYFIIQQPANITTS